VTPTETPSSRDLLIGLLTVGAAASIWGTLGFFAKLLYAEGVSFEALVAVRASVGWAAMLLFLLLTRGLRSLQIARRDLLFLVPLGLVGVGAFYLLYFFTVRESTVGTAAILLYSSPAFVVVLAWIFLKEPLGFSRILALGLTFGGIFLVVGGYDPSTLEVWASEPCCSCSPPYRPYTRLPGSLWDPTLCSSFWR
jgi:DME family drug/metabolite transporter